MFTITVGALPIAAADTPRRAANALGELLLNTLTPTHDRQRWQIDNEAGLVLLGEIGLGRPECPEAVREAVDTVVQDTHLQLAVRLDPDEQN